MHYRKEANTADAYRQAPKLQTERWFNCDQPPTLEALRGRVVVIEALQMLCPGCVAHGIPQAQRIDDTFPDSDVFVLGLHTVFEHHAAMTPVALEAFLHEYRIGFPVGVDQAGSRDVPRTMQAYELRGTPSLILIDAAGRLRQQWFGRPGDLVVGAEIMRLIRERDQKPGAAFATPMPDTRAGDCGPDGCTV